MGISIIVTRSLDPKSTTGDSIALNDWLHLVDADPALKRRDQPTVVNTPSGAQISVPSLPGQTELRDDGELISFLGYRQGDLVMAFHPSMEVQTNPIRKKIAEVARRLGAVITHDAGDEVLDW